MNALVLEECNQLVYTEVPEPTLGPEDVLVRVEAYGICGKVHVHRANSSSAGVQTDGGAMFASGMSGVLGPLVNDLWTVPGDEGHITVEIHTAIYRSQRARAPVKFPVSAAGDADDFDGRLSRPPPELPPWRSCCIITAQYSDRAR